MVHSQEPTNEPDPPRNADIAVPETSAEGIARLDRDKVGHRTDPKNPLVASADSLTRAVEHLDREVHRRSVGFLIALVLIAILGISLTIVGYRSEHFLTCQANQNTEFREAGKTERAAQRKLFDVILNPNSTPADRLKATQDYRAGLVAADQQRSNSNAAAETC